MASCGIEYTSGGGNPSVPCGRPAVGTCGDCGAPICGRCWVQCCGESFCGQCFDYHVKVTGKKPSHNDRVILPLKRTG
jgi:hypothetical protein